MNRQSTGSTPIDPNVVAIESVDKLQRYTITRRVTLVGAVVDLLLGVSKIAVGQLAHSQALVADGVHSLSDLMTDFMVIWAAKHASRGPDAGHPYGHQRIETLASIVLGILLCVVALGIAYDAIMTLVKGETLPTPGVTALVIATLSVVSKEVIYHYTMRAARQLQSELLRSNAWHSRSDAFSSVVVIVGLLGTMFGYVFFDAVAAVIVAAMIAWIGGQVIVNGARELVDTAPDPGLVDEIRKVACSIEGVADIHDVRTRRMGSDILLDGHVLLQEPKISVSEGHQIGEAVRNKLKREFSDLSDIVIHVDAEDDKSYQQSAHLPLRGELLKDLQKSFSGVPGAKSIKRTVLHYLDGGVRVELWLTLDEFADMTQAKHTADALRLAGQTDPRVRTMDILFV